MKNTCFLVPCILSFEGSSYERIQDTASLQVPLFLVVLQNIRTYISRYHFYNFLEPNPTFTEKKFSSRIFFLRRIQPNPTPP